VTADLLQDFLGDWLAATPSVRPAQISWAACRRDRVHQLQHDPLAHDQAVGQA